MAQNGPNGPELSKWSRMVQTVQNSPNGPKWSKIIQKWSEMAQDDPNGPKKLKV